MISEEIAEKYKGLLKTHKEAIKAYAPVFTKNQTRFFNVVLDIVHNTDLTWKKIAERQGCCERTVKSAAKVVKGMYLPFRYSERLDCRRIEQKTHKGLSVSTLRSLSWRARQKYGVKKGSTEPNIAP